MDDLPRQRRPQRQVAHVGHLHLWISVANCFTVARHAPASTQRSRRAGDAVAARWLAAVRRRAVWIAPSPALLVIHSVSPSCRSSAVLRAVDANPPAA